MGVVQVRLPDEVQEIIRRQVAEGRAAGVDEYVAEAVRRYAEELDLEDELAAGTRAGIADIEAGRHRTMAPSALDDGAGRVNDAVRQAQALVRKYAPNARGVVDELLRERRADAERE